MILEQVCWGTVFKEPCNIGCGFVSLLVKCLAYGINSFIHSFFSSSTYYVPPSLTFHFQSILIYIPLSGFTFPRRLAKGEAHKKQSEIGCKSGHSSCRPGGERNDFQAVGNHLVGKQIWWWPSPKALGHLSKLPKGVIPGPIMGWSNFKCYERMEISTCVIAKLNKIFVWKPNGPPCISVLLCSDQHLSVWYL